MNSNPLLIADVGGTNARLALAWSEQPYFVQAQTFQVIDFENAENSIATYLEANQISELAGMCFSVAGAILDGNGWP